MVIDQQVEAFIQKQREGARGQRLERLQKELVGERKLLGSVLIPVLKSFDGLVLEYELVSPSGVRIFIDVFYEPLGLAFESEGYVVHAEVITRERFSFERSRMRAIAMHGYKYIPFTWDEIEKKPEICQREVYELLGRFSSAPGRGFAELSVYERELLRFALRLNRPFRLADACACLGLVDVPTRKVIRSLMEKKLVLPLGKGSIRFHEYLVDHKAALPYL